MPAVPAAAASRKTWLVLALALCLAAVLLWTNRNVIKAELDPYLWQQPPTDANPLGMPAIVVSAAQERQVPGWFSPELFAKGVESNLSKFDEFVVLAPVDNMPMADTDYRLDLVFNGQPSSVLGTVRLVCGRSGQPYGVLYAQVLSDPNRTADQVCLLSGYEWFQVPERDRIEPIRQCLDGLIKRKPGNHVA